MKHHIDKIDRLLLKEGLVTRLATTSPNKLSYVSSYDYGDFERFIYIDITECQITVGLSRALNRTKKEFSGDNLSYQEIADTYKQFHRALTRKQILERAKLLKKTEEFAIAEEVYIPKHYQLIVDLIGLSESELRDRVHEHCVTYWKHRTINRESMNVIFAVAKKLGMPDKEIKETYQRVGKTIEAAKKLI